MRCYFNFSDGYQVLRDEEGIDVSSLDRARIVAFQVIREVSRDTAAAEFDWSNWTLSLTDADGQVLQSVSLGDVITEGDNPAVTHECAEPISIP
jgi:hypothetical protein